MCVATATSTAVSGIASARFRSGRCQSCRSASSSTSSPSRNRIRISATTARPWTNSDVGSKSSAPKPASPSTRPASTKPAVSERKLRSASPETSAPSTSSTPNAASGASRNSTPAPSGIAQLCHEIAKRVYDGPTTSWAVVGEVAKTHEDRRQITIQLRGEVRFEVGGNAHGGPPPRPARTRAARLPRPEPAPRRDARRADGRAVAGGGAARPRRDAQHAAVRHPARPGRRGAPGPLRAAARAAARRDRGRGGGGAGARGCARRATR